MRLLGRCLTVLCFGFAYAGIAAEDLSEIIAVPKAEWAKTRLEVWVQSNGITEPKALEAIEKFWPKEGPIGRDELLTKVVGSFAAADEETAEFLKSLQTVDAFSTPNPRPLFTSKVTSPYYEANLRVYLGRFLTHRLKYEEALEILSPVSPSETVDPAGLFFYRATCLKFLGLYDEAAAELSRLRLMEGAPARYTATGSLMESDIQMTERKSLGDISNKMADVKRRLLLARAGEKTQKLEKEIVDLLDEMIKKKEDEAKQNKGGDGEGQKSGKTEKAGAQAAKQSQVKGATAPGEVDKKKVKLGPSWGNLPEKERAKAKNAISRDFPPYYRQTIEAYFRKLAERDSK